MSTHNELGKQGEEMATDFLRKKGYKIIALNWRFGKEEIDIIAQTEQTLVFVEVKTRSSSYFETPQQAVTLKKQKFLINAANQYILKNNIDFEARFDVVSIISNSTFQQIEHIENAFYPSL